MPKRTSVVWTRPALDVLLDIVRHIQSDKPAAASKHMIRFSLGAGTRREDITAAVSAVKQSTATLRA